MKCITIRDMEIWKPIPGFVGYEASTHGRIRKSTAKILAPEMSRKHKSYPRVAINNRKLGGTYRRKHMFVHALVAKAFIGECPPSHEHNHIDGNRMNNRPENLEFVTPSENQRHSIDVLGKATGRKGTQHGMAKLTETQVISIHSKRKAGATLAQLQAEFGVSASAISTICQRRSWTHLNLEKLPDMR